MGIRNKWSIAYGIAKAASEHGAKLLFTFIGEDNRSKIEELVLVGNVANKAEGVLVAEGANVVESLLKKNLQKIKDDIICELDTLSEIVAALPTTKIGDEMRRLFRNA